MTIDVCGAARLLEEKEDILILTHSHPDGDTLGSAFALCRAVKTLGKRASVLCGDEIPADYSFMYNASHLERFEPRFIMAVDVADTKLLGDDVEALYADKIELCIDHHGSNKRYARQLLLDASAAAAAEIVYAVIAEMGCEIDTDIANCLYAGISTDTGCFRYTNTTAATHRLAAVLMDAGADTGMIDRVFFETKSRGFIEMEKLALSGMRFDFEGRCAVIVLKSEMFKQTGCLESECDLISAIPRQIKGVLIGATVREQNDGSFKLSVRTHPPLDAAALCAKMGGGGHARAAGCRSEKPLAETLEEFLRYAGEALSLI